ncbi:MAG: HD family phosphohydrolase [Rubricoccaceae bacterium]
MSLLRRLPLPTSAASRSRRAGLRLEGRPSDPAPRLTPREVGIRLAVLAALAVLGLLAFPRASVYDGTGRIGDVWRTDDVVAPFDFAIRLPEAEIEARRDSVRLSEPGIFNENPEALAVTLARVDSLRARLSPALGAFASWQLARRDGDGAAARADSLRFFALRDRIPLTLSDREWGYLAQSALEQAVGVRRTSLADQLLDETARLSRELLARGVFDVARDSVRSAEIVVRNVDPRERTERLVPAADVLSVGEALVLARQSLAATFEGRPDTVEVGATLLRTVLEPSLVFQEEATRLRVEERMAEVQPTRGRVQQGMTIIRRGDEVTPERYDQLRSLVLAQRERAGGSSWVRTVAGRTVLVLAALTLLALYLLLLRRPLVEDLRQLLLIALLVAAALVGFMIAGSVGGSARYGVPVALVSVLLTIIYDSRVGSFVTMTLALLGGLLSGYDFTFTFATLLAGIMAVFSVRDVKSRSQLLATAGLVFGTFAAILFAFAALRADPLSGRLLGDLTAAGVHAVLILLAAPILWAFERTFGVTTDLTLLELSDTNRPLLKELSLRAPGTFSHVLQVANLAEAAADAIGANALRARVGALYHDIGKMIKPEYFIENQRPGENPHDRLSPYMSALVIAAHVKDGAELAREQRLPKVIYDFIPTHHGTALIEYFYRRAQEQAGPDGPPVDEAEFRYPGPRPQTNEQAVVMLADSVEAASRSLDRPTPRRLEALIDSIFKARIEDGQLNSSSLTFSDLSRIKETFLSILCGIYHFRVKYPGQEASSADEGGSAGQVPAGSATPPEQLSEAGSHRGAEADDADDADAGSAGPQGAAPTSEERATMG